MDLLEDKADRMGHLKVDEASMSIIISSLRYISPQAVQEYSLGKHR